MIIDMFFNNSRWYLRKLIKQKKYDEALKYGHEIEKKIEYDPDIAFIIGTVYFMKGNEKETLSYMNKTLDIGEYDIDALSIKASVYLHQKNKIKANECCEKICEIDPKNKILKQIDDGLKNI